MKLNSIEKALMNEASSAALEQYQGDLSHNMSNAYAQEFEIKTANLIYK